MVNCYYRTLLILTTANIAVAAWTEPRVGVPTCTHAGLRLVKNHWAYCQQIISLDYNFKQWIEIWDSVPKYCGPIYHEIGQAAVACWSHFPTYFANCSGTTPMNATLSAKSLLSGCDLWQTILRVSFHLILIWGNGHLSKRKHKYMQI